MNTDVLHEKSSHIEWSESFYFNFYDEKNDICGFMRIGLKPNKSIKNMFCFFMLSDGSYIGLKDDDVYDSDFLAAKGLSFKMIEPERKWGMSFDGALVDFSLNKEVRVSFDFEFSGLNEIFDYRNCVSGFKEKISQSVASEHLEQFGRVVGELTVRGKKYAVSGLGERDHSWGVRDWNAPKMWIWLTSQFSETLALNVTKLSVSEGEVDAGFIYIGGENRPVVKADIKTTYREDGSPEFLDIEITDETKEMHKIKARVLKSIRLPFVSSDGKSQSAMYETLCEYQFDGKKGYGIAEYLIREF